MPVWNLAKCHLAMLIYKLLSALNVTEVSDALVTRRDTNALLKEKNLYINKKEPLNARHIRSTFKAKEAMQYTNALICMGRLFYDFV